MYQVLGAILFITPFVAFYACVSALFNLNFFTFRKERHRRINALERHPMMYEFRSQVVRWTVFVASLGILAVYSLVMILFLLR